MGGRAGRTWRRCKRLVDVVGAAVLLVLLLPALSIILAVVWATGGAPIYGHERIGRGGRPFLCWKVRTMVPDTEARLEGHPARRHGPKPTSGRATTSSGRSAGDAAGTMAAADEPRRAAAALQRAQGRDEPRRPTSGDAAPELSAVRGERAALPGGSGRNSPGMWQARRPQRPSLRAPCAARPLFVITPIALDSGYCADAGRLDSPDGPLE